MPDRLLRVLVLFETSQQVMRGIARYNRLYGPWEFYHPLPYYREQLSWSRQLDRMRKFNPDGVIAHLHNEKQARELLAYVAKDKPAIISLHSGQVMDGVIPIIGDEAGVARMAVQHFLDRGFYHFGYCGFSDIHWSIARQNEFARHLKSHGHTVNIYQVPKTRRYRVWESERPLVGQWIQSLPKPVAILACNDDRGREVLEACRSINAKVPEEVAVLGVGDHELICELFEPTLSSINTDRQKAGFESAKLLDDLMKGRPNNQTQIIIEALPGTTRRSTDIIAVPDEQLAEALRYIRANFKKMIQVADVANYVAVSRRGLERRFQKYLNRSIHDEIRRLQIEYVCLLLRETEMSISEISAKLGHIDLDCLSRMFRKETGQSPRAYRKAVKG